MRFLIAAKAYELVRVASLDELPSVTPWEGTCFALAHSVQVLTPASLH